MGDWTRAISPVPGQRHALWLEPYRSQYRNGLGSFRWRLWTDPSELPNSNPVRLIGLLGLNFGGGTPSRPGHRHDQQHRKQHGHTELQQQSVASRRFDHLDPWSPHVQVWRRVHVRQHHRLLLGEQRRVGEIVFGPNFTASSATTTDRRCELHRWQRHGRFLPGLAQLPLAAASAAATGCRPPTSSLDSLRILGA